MSDVQNTISLESILARAEAQQTNIDETTSRVEDRLNPEDLSRAKVDLARQWLAIAIITVYCLATLGTLLYLGYMVTRAPRGAVSPYAAQMIDVLKVVVLPVVTFMLGFYFGTSTTSNQSRVPSRRER